eukprot:8199788-Alexandrium_andersonii.AAC.1
MARLRVVSMVCLQDSKTPPRFLQVSSRMRARMVWVSHSALSLRCSLSSLAREVRVRGESILVGARVAGGVRAEAGTCGWAHGYMPGPAWAVWP